MATLIRFVNTAAHTSGDGTTNGTGNGGTNSFVSVAAALAALQQTLTGVTCDVADEFGNLTIAMDIVCTGTTADAGGQWAPTSTWVTNATHRLRIRGSTISGGKWDTTKYHLTDNTAFVGSLRITTAINITLQDIQIENTATQDNSPHAIRADEALWDLHIVRGFYRITGTTGTPGNCSTFFANADQYILQGQSVVFASAGITTTTVVLGGSGTTPFSATRLYNCTIIDRGATGGAGLAFNSSTSDSTRFANLLIQSPTLCYNVENQTAVNTANGLSATILTNDTSSPTVGLRSKTCVFVDPTNWDYHSAVSDPSVGAGTDLHADSFMPFNTDCDGNPR